MQNRIVITICGQEYTLVAEESQAYMEEVANYVSEKMEKLIDSSHVSHTDGAVLTALNITDELFKSKEADEKLRAQFKTYADDLNKANNEISELKRQVFRLQQRLDKRNHNG